MIFDSYLNFPVPHAALQSAADAARVVVPVDSAPPMIVLSVCGEAMNAESKRILQAWMLVLGTLPAEAFAVEIVPEFRFAAAEIIAVRCKFTRLLETALEAAKMEASRRVEGLPFDREPVEPWIVLGRGTSLPRDNLPPSFGFVDLDALRISCPAKTIGRVLPDGMKSKIVAHLVLEEARLAAEEEDVFE